ncbi:hypothetical protein KKH23_10555 [Patescibacteria group bacterium]|nr:hypothetical protein [Patescibacteria group bacterium]
MMRWRVIVVLITLSILAAIVSTAHAATPITFALGTPQAFRHVLDDSDDLLVLEVLKLTPIEKTGLSDTFSVDTTSGAFDDPVVLTNRVYWASAPDYVVVADGTDDISDACTFAADNQTMDCTATGLSDATHSIVVTYRSGWGAYSGSDVLVRLLDGVTVISERTSPGVGCVLVGHYLSAAAFTASGITWGSGTVAVKAIASPSLWDSPHTASLAMTWNSDADHTAFQTTMANQLQLVLDSMENSPECGLSDGDYVQTTGITDAGQTVAAAAFSLIGQAVPTVFQTSSYNPFTQPTPTPALAAIAAADAAASSTLVRISTRAISEAFPVGLTLTLALVAAVVTQAKVKSTALAFIFAWTVMLAGKLLFGESVPTPIVFLPAALLVAFGAWQLVKSLFES